MVEVQRYILSPVLFLLLIVLGEIQVLNGNRLFLSERLCKNPLRKEKKASQNFSRVDFKNRVKLPEAIVPIHYDLEMLMVLDKGTIYEEFSAPGTVKILVECISPTDRISMHASPILKINESSVMFKNLEANSEVPVTGHEYNSTLDFYTILLGQQTLVNTQYEIHIQFIAPISVGRVDGLYLTQFTTSESNEINNMAVTQFAGTYARQAFPCFDQPNFRATFDIRIGHDEKYIALSNGELLNSSPINEMVGWVLETFETSQKMPTYLLAMIVGNLRYEQAELMLPGNKLVRIYGPPDLIVDRSGGKFAANMSAQVMTYFEEIFEIEYKMSKMYSVAVPNFLFGAMENWGLITYKDPFILYFEGETTEAERYRISSIIAHESAHQWFGNLVTFSWWDNVWLSEGFATALSTIGGSHITPEFEPSNLFINEIYQLALLFDGDPSFTHPVINDALYPDQIYAYYDEISYEKAGSLLRMLSVVLTQKTFMSSLHTYLSTKSFQSTEQDELFRIFQEQAVADGTADPSLTVKDIMDTWTLQAGFPLVRVSKGFQDGTLLISQERFLNIDPKNDEWNPNDLWNIPISIASKDEDELKTVWLEKNISLKVVPHDGNGWVVANLDAIGYFRILYDQNLFSLISNQLRENHEEIKTLSRSQLIDDYFNLAFNRYIPIQGALELTKYLGKETEFSVWNAFFNNMDYAYTIFEGTPSFGALKAYFKPIFENVLASIGLDQPIEEIGSRVIFRSKLLDWACGLNLEICTNYSINVVQQWLSDPLIKKLPLESKSIVICSAVRIGPSVIYESMLNKYVTEGSEKLRLQILNGIGCTKNYLTIAGLLSDINQNDGTFLESDKLTLFKSIIGNPNGRNVALVSLSDNFEVLLSKFGAGGIAELLNSFSIYTKSEIELANLENFVNEHKDQLGEVMPKILKSLEYIQINIHWKNSFQSPMEEWFKANL